MENSEDEDSKKSLIDISHVASGVGHHVINAFAAIVSNAEIIRLTLANRSNIDRDALANIVIRTALDASVVARRLIDFSRPHTFVGTGLVSLHELVEDYLDDRRARDVERRVEWVAEATPVPPIKGNAHHIREMLDRLIQNSVDAASSHTNLRLVLRTSLDNRGWVVLEVADTGMGMESGVLERAIEPFYSTKPGRVGVGLTIANGIWRRHRGTLSLKSQPGEGTVARLCVDPRGHDNLPVTRGVPESSERDAGR